MSKPGRNNVLIPPSPDASVVGLAALARTDRNWWRIVAVGCMALTGYALYTRQAPRPIVEAYSVGLQPATGEIQAIPLKAYTPAENEIRRALKDHVVQQFSIEPIISGGVVNSRTRKQLAIAEARTVGAARQAFSDWIASDKPLLRLAQSPQLVRSVSVKGVSLQEDNTGIVIFETETRENLRDKTGKVERYSFSARYQFIAPDSKTALGDNPTGLTLPFTKLEEIVQ